jgi:hypothetical protein
MTHPEIRAEIERSLVLCTQATNMHAELGVFRSLTLALVAILGERFLHHVGTLRVGLRARGWKRTRAHRLSLPPMAGAWAPGEAERRSCMIKFTT